MAIESRRRQSPRLLKEKIIRGCVSRPQYGGLRISFVQSFAVVYPYDNNSTSYRFIDIVKGN